MPVLAKEILDGIDEVWNNPVAFTKDLAPFGIMPIDKATGGVRLHSGGMYVIQGFEGSRKTTYLLNIIINQFLSGRITPGYWMCYDTLETGVTVESLIETMICILATRILVYWHWNECEERDILKLFSMGLPKRDIPELIESTGVTADGRFRRETILRPSVLRNGGWTERQKRAISMAKSIISGFQFMVCGQSEHRDEEIAKSRTDRTTDLKESYLRWLKLTREWGVRQLFVDNVPQYQFEDTDNAYDKVVRLNKAVVAWLNESRGLAWVVNQVPTHARKSSSKTDLPLQFGGARLLEETNYGVHLHYDQRTNPWHFHIAIKKSRIGFHPDVTVAIEPNSGAIVGTATLRRSRV